MKQALGVVCAASLCACAGPRPVPPATNAVDSAVPQTASASIAPPAPPPAPSSPTRSPAAVANDLFREGEALMEAGKIKEACARFEESQRLAPDLLTSLAVAECEIAAGDVEQGCAHLQVVERQSHAAGHSERSYRTVQERVRAHALDCE